MIYNYDDNLRYHDDVKNKFGFANINAFPKNSKVYAMKEILLRKKYLKNYNLVVRLFAYEYYFCLPW